MPLAVELQHIECVYEHDERERGIQSAGQADDRRFCVRVAQTGGKASCLKREDLLAALVAQCLVRRNERRARECTVSKIVLHWRKREREHAALDRCERVHALTLVCKALEVDIRVMMPCENILLSASSAPFSAMRSWPAKTRSCVDSPKPASAYRYAHSSRPDC